MNDLELDRLLTRFSKYREVRQQAGHLIRLLLEPDRELTVRSDEYRQATQTLRQSLSAATKEVPSLHDVLDPRIELAATQIMRAVAHRYI